MYDQSETGFLIHFYTIALNGLFFEILQRSKYANYGESNAHVRMAAQARLRQQETVDRQSPNHGHLPEAASFHKPVLI